MQFFDPSSKAMQSDATSAKPYRFKEQFENVPVGKVFVIPYAEIEAKNLRPLASNVGKKLKKRFKVVTHDDRQMFEVLRLPDVIEQEQQGQQEQRKPNWDINNKVEVV